MNRTLIRPFSLLLEQAVKRFHGSTGEWSDRGLTHSNLSEPLHRLIKEQRERFKVPVYYTYWLVDIY